MTCSINHPMKGLMNRLVLLAVLAVSTTFAAAQPKSSTERAMSTHPYVGIWVTADGTIRHELLPNNRYDEARGNRKSAYQGRYTIKGNRIDYVDDTGFSADGEFIEGVLYHAGMVLQREKVCPR